MTCTRVASVVLVTSISALFGCTSSDTVVAANVQSSNDNQYNSATDNGRKGGLLKPGIPDGILHPDSATPDLIRVAKTVRIILSQPGQPSIAREVVPKATTSWSLDVTDQNGEKVLGSDGKPLQEEHVGISQFFERIALTDSWKGEGQAAVEALDDSGQVILSAPPLAFNVEEHGAVYVLLDLKLPVPPTPQGGAGGAAGAGNSSAGTAGTAGSAGTAGTAGTVGTAGSAASTAGTAGAAGIGGTAGSRG